MNDDNQRPALVGRTTIKGFQIPRPHIDEATGKSAHASTAVRKKFKKRPRANSVAYAGSIAAEPGLDYRTLDVEGFDISAEITITDYSAEQCSVSRIETLEDLQKVFEDDRPAWAKVRWINVHGLNWQYIKLLASQYNLHRLAIEDMLSVQRTKTDWYHDHIYICLLMHVLIDDNNQIMIYDEGPQEDQMQERSRKLLSSRFKELFKHKSEGTGAESSFDPNKYRSQIPIAQHHSPDRDLIYDEMKPSRESSLMVAVEQVSIFLTHDGTLLTFFQQSGRVVEDPIVQRLESESTILRTSEDASLLLQSVIDAIVDLSFPITTAYQELIADLEIDVLTNPHTEHTRELHIVSGELGILKRTLYPLYNMIYSLQDRRHSKRGGHIHLPSGSDHDEDKHGVHISNVAKLYLADVADHVLILTEEVDILRATIENMINLIFNLVSATQNETMRQLTTVTIIFLPLAFLAGYFGMNFNQEFWRVLTNNGPIYFWQIAIPTTVFVMVVLTYSYLRRLIKTLGRQLVRKGVKIKLRKNREMRRHRGSIAVSRRVSREEKLSPTATHL